MSDCEIILVSVAVTRLLNGDNRLLLDIQIRRTSCMNAV